MPLNAFRSNVYYSAHTLTMDSCETNGEAAVVNGQHPTNDKPTSGKNAASCSDKAVCPAKASGACGGTTNGVAHGANAGAAGGVAAAPNGAKPVSDQSPCCFMFVGQIGQVDQVGQVSLVRLQQQH